MDQQMVHIQQPQQPHHQPPQLQQVRAMTHEEINYKELCEKLSAVEKEISSLRRKRTDLNKKNKLVSSNETYLSFLKIKFNSFSI